ncbi:MAG: ParB/RepB/Spo0J family partition protein [Pirellulaceae bacterium]|nr:ParB/RepB/Spo0J family partition protein [Pirellulaceae bacterium]
MSKKKRLGRGLEALLGVGGPQDAPSQEDVADVRHPDFGKAIPTAGDRAANLPANDGAGPSPKSPGPMKTLVQSMRENSAQESAKEFEQDSGPRILRFESPETSVADQKSDDLMAKREATITADSDGPMPKTAVRAEEVAATQPTNEPSRSDSTSASLETAAESVQLNVYDVDDNPFQPRREFNKAEIESLAESLKSHDQLQPILVRKTGDRYQLISGERRLRAAIHAGWSQIQAQVREADDRLVAELAIVENLQRKDLNPIEKAFSFRRYIDEHRCPQDELANRLKIDRSTVANLLRLLELPPAVQKALQIGLISNGHARALLPLGEEHLQIEFCNRVQRDGLSVRAIEQIVRERIAEEDGAKTKKGVKKKAPSSQIASLENELRTALGTRVEIKNSNRGRGKMIIHYSSPEEFQRLREFMNETHSPTDGKKVA